MVALPSRRQLMQKSLRGTWKQAFLSFFFPVLVVLSIRWFGVEPYVIPSGSMIPSLLVQDHIVVNKLSFGLRNPFSNEFLVQWASPRAGDIVVFRYPNNPDVFYVKRVVALPGDRIKVEAGKVIVNDVPISQRAIESIEELSKQAAFPIDEGYEYLIERNHLVRFRDREASEMSELLVPQDSYFVMGDNRDESSDSRSWGFVPEQNLVGRAKWIWMSCQRTLASAPFLCDPTQLRWARFFQSVEKEPSR